MNKNLKRTLEVLSGALSAVAPWIDKLLSLNLLGNYYRPHADILATFLALCAFLWRYFTFHKVKAARPKRIWAGCSFAVLVVSCLACLWISMNLGVTFNPDPGWLEAWRLAWCGLYVIAAMSLAVMLASLVRLVS